MIIYCAIIAILLAVIGWAHGYVRRENAALPVTSAPLPRASVHPDMDTLMEELDAETERWAWKAIAKGPGHRVWRSDPMFEDGQILHAFEILGPGEDAPAAGTVFSWS